MENPVKFAMPGIAMKRLPVLSADELKSAMDTCQDKREEALLLFLADSGLRRAETYNLNWKDIDMQTGLVRLERAAQYVVRHPPDEICFFLEVVWH